MHYSVWTQSVLLIKNNNVVLSGSKKRAINVFILFIETQELKSAFIHAGMKTRNFFMRGGKRERCAGRLTEMCIGSDTKMDQVRYTVEVDWHGPESSPK